MVHTHLEQQLPHLLPLQVKPFFPPHVASLLTFPEGVGSVGLGGVEDVADVEDVGRAEDV